MAYSEAEKSSHDRNNRAAAIERDRLIQVAGGGNAAVEIKLKDKSFGRDTWFGRETQAQWQTRQDGEAYLRKLGGGDLNKGLEIFKKRQQGNTPPSSGGGGGGGSGGSKGAVTPPQPAPPPYKARVGKPQSKPNFGPYRYPQDAIEEGQDFIKFDILTYKRGGLVTRDDKNLKGDILGTILLPIPSQIGDNNVANFGSGNLNFMEEFGLNQASKIIGSSNVEDFVKNTLGAAQGAVELGAANSQMVKQYFAAQAVNSLGSNITLDQLLARSGGQVLNPNMELLFSGPGLRQFKFTFKFTPRFEKEATEVKNIIKAFKRNMAPKGSGDNFLSTPNIFQIQYMQGDRQHKFLNKFKLCALTNMSVNYTGDGVHATYYDGTPISMQMDLSFSELTPIYNEDYDDYGSDTGVGY
jgi:hypothetical protein